jgi:hypothetical protein
MDQGQLDLAQSRRVSIRPDIINVILSGGELSKGDIKLMWSLDEDAYADFRTELAEENLIEPRHAAGFSAKFKRPPEGA